MNAHLTSMPVVEHRCVTSCRADRVMVYTEYERVSPRTAVRFSLAFGAFRKRTLLRV